MEKNNYHSAWKEIWKDFKEVEYFSWLSGKPEVDIKKYTSTELRVDGDFSNRAVTFLTAFLHIKIFTVEQTGLTYRVINHWDSEGLLEIDKYREKGWRKFSLTDIFWLSIIKELRAWGLSLEKIKSIKKDLFDKDSEKKQGVFDIYLLYALSGKSVKLVVSEYEVAGFMLKDEFLKEIHSNFANFTSSYLVLDLFQVIGGASSAVLSKLQNKPDFGDLAGKLTPEETNLLLLIREGDFKEVRVKFKNKKPQSFEGVETYKKLAHILEHHNYEEIKTVKNNGQVVYVERTVKGKF